MLLTSENYFSVEMSKKYLGVSQYKDFMGTMAKQGCEELALAKINGEWDTEKSTALLVGSYVDSHFENTLNIFKSKNPELFKKDGGLKADYVRAEEVINRIEQDQLFMQFMSGNKQTIMTADMFGSPWKIKIDSYLEGVAIVDLKVMANLRDFKYVRDFGHVNFIHQWGYYIQGAVYQEVVFRNTGKRLPFYLAASSKEKEPDLEIIQLEQSLMDEALIEVERNTPNIVLLKNKEVEPTRCGLCDYCKHTKVLTKPIWSSELLGEI